MRHKLGDSDTGYSPAEREIFSLLPAKPKKISSAELMDKKLSMLMPSSVPATLRSLARKVRKNREGFEICRSRRSGPNPIYWWVEGKQ